MSELNKLFPEILLAYVNDTSCELTNEKCNELSKLAEKLESRATKAESDLTRLTQELEEERDNKQGKSYAPWTDEQVECLERWQDDGKNHPFTCVCGESLIPYKDGWLCDSCGHKQNWCHNFMLSSELPNEVSQ